MSTFAEAVSLRVVKPASDMNEVEAHLLGSLMSEWKKNWDRVSSESHRGNVRLENFMADNETTPELMSERLRSVKAYGMAESMRS